MNKRVLLFWREGDGIEFTYISIILDDEIIPNTLEEGVFRVGIITKDSHLIENMEIFVPLINKTIKHAGSYQFK